MSRSASPPELRRLEEEYRGLAPLGDTFCSEVSRQLARLLDDKDVTLGFPIESRVKQWASISEKLERKALALNTLNELTDLVGLRVVLLFQRDVATTCKAIEEHFTVLESQDTQERLREDQFGYSSRHYVIQLPENWLSLPTFFQLGALRAEIQVRTVAQHIWAAASHKLQYKQEQSVPMPVRRSISRVSALLETVDLELERVLTEREMYRESLEVVSLDIIAEGGNEPLNVDLLERILAENFPAENKSEAEDFGELLENLMQAGVNTTGQLEAVIAKHREETLKDDAAMVQMNQAKLAKGLPIYGTAPDRIERGVYFTHAGLARGCLRAAQLEWQAVPKVRVRTRGSGRNKRGAKQKAEQ